MLIHVLERLCSLLYSVLVLRGNPLALALVKLHSLDCSSGKHGLFDLHELPFVRHADGRDVCGSD